jgi:putative peptidoglycan lipid II flippase
MIRKLFSGQINSITIAALLVALSSLVSRFLGIFRDRILAGEFGAGDVLDIYYAAFRVPDVIFNLLVLGALSAGFIPMLTGLIKDHKCQDSVQKLRKKNAKAWDLTSNLINIMGIVLIGLSVLGIIFAPVLTKLIVPGFSPEKQFSVAMLTRIMFLSPIFLGISSVFGGVLQSFKRFFVYSLSPILYNLGIIIGALFLVPKWEIYGLAWGVVLGAFMHMMVQLPMIFSLGFRYKLSLDLHDKYLRKIAVMMVPRTLSLATAQINLLVITIMASGLEEGSLSVFNFANNLQSFPIGIFGISFAVAAFPVLSAVAFDKKKLIMNFSLVFRQILFFIVPATIMLLALRAQIVRVILGTGQFGWQDTLATIDTLGFFTISLFAQASIPLLVRIFYARHNSKTPFYIGIFAVFINVILSFWLPKIIVAREILDSSGVIVEIFVPLGVSGLALAFSIASVINFIILWLALRFEIGELDEERILISAIKFSGAAIAAGIVVQGIKLLIWPYIDMTKMLGVLTQGLSAGIAGILVYIAFCSLFKSEELFDFWASIKRRLPWNKVETGDQGEARGI